MATYCSSCGAPHPEGSSVCPRCAPAQERDVLTDGPPDVRPDTGPRRGKRRALVVGAAALLATGVGVGAVYAGTQLGGGGAQPQDVLPASAVGFVQVDLDPGAGQKIAAYRLAKKFPDSGVGAEDDVKDDLLRRLLASEEDVDYDRELRPWLGDRAGVAFLPPTAEAPGEPVVVAAVQVSDRAKAEQGLRALASEEGSELHWALSEDEDYALLSDDQAAVEAAVRDEEHLADAPAFVRGVEALEGDQIAFGWVDVGAVWGVVPAQDKDEVLREQPGLRPEGVVVMGASVEADHVEVVGKTVGLSLGDTPELQALRGDGLTEVEPRGLIEDLPADSLGAFSATGIGDALTDLYSTFEKDHGSELEDLQAAADEYGVRLPDDLRALLGQELAVSIAGDLQAEGGRGVLHVATQDGARGVELVQQVLDIRDDVPEGVEVEQVEDGYQVTYDATGSSAPASGRLGDSDVFRRTVPDAAESRLTYYVDLQGALRQVEQADGEALSETVRRNVAPLRGVGYTVTAEDGLGDASFRMRVTVE